MHIPVKRSSRPCLDDLEVLDYLARRFRWHTEAVECLDDRAVQAWLGGSLPDPEADAVRTHLDTCDSCSDLIAAVVETHWVGQSLGRYRLTERLGGGAMGEVYRAEDPDLGRDVAIKLVRLGGSQRRLLREAQAMAQLTHPHVIRIYDVGTIGEDVFLAMELVKGKTLRGWFRERHGWRTIVSTLRQAGGGLAAAHEAKLVHGDFKPDNVLVADDGRVLVTDFGLVRSSVDDGVDASVGLAGTPAYMAPEQFEAPVATTASDQFSFCVSLFEALYGRRPFDGTDLDTLRASLAAGRVEVPSRRGVPARIVRALRRGLAARPTDRFPSMKALLAELDASSRSRMMWIAAGAAVATIAISTTAFLATRGNEPCSDGAEQLAGVWDATTRDGVKRAFDASKLPYAATSLATVTAMLDGYRGRWLATYTDTCKATHVRKEQSEALLDVRMACMRRRREEARAVVQELTRGTVRDSVTTVAALRPISDCEDLESLQEIKQLPTDRAGRELIAALDVELARCRALLGAGRYQPAQACALAAVKSATELGYEPSIAEAEMIAGTTATRLRAWSDAESSLTRSLLAAEVGRDPRARASALIWLVAVAAERATFEQGHSRDDHASAIVKSLGNEGNLAAQLAYHRGNLFLREGKLADAEKALQQAIALAETLYGPNDARVGEPLGLLAVVNITRKQYDPARALLDRAMKIQLAAFGPSHPTVGKTLHAVAQLEARAGKLDKALDAQRRSYELLVAAYGENHRDVALSVGMAAQANLLAGKYAEAVPFAKRSVELMEKAAGPDSPDTAVALQTLAATYSRAGNSADALATHQRVLAIQLKVLGPDHLQTTQTQVNLAMALRIASRCDESLPLLQAALTARTKLFGPDHPDIGRVLQTTGDCLVDLGRAQEAVAPLERALELREAQKTITADDRVSLAMVQYGLGRALWDTGARDRAVTLVRAGHAALTELKDKRASGLAEWATERRVKLD